MKRFNVSNTPLDGVKCIERIPANDNRGNFARIFCEIDFHENGWREPVRQINITNTMKKGTVRGMHYQSDPKMEAKIVTCLKGEIFDVVVIGGGCVGAGCAWEAATRGLKVALIERDDFAAGTSGYVKIDNNILSLLRQHNWFN
jgi:hypothetical protein